MEVLIPARQEVEVLASVHEEATAEEIRVALETRAEDCVNSKCGCSTSC